MSRKAVRILMLVSNDSKFLEPRSAANAWVQDRHVAYGERIDRLCILVKTTGKRWETRPLSDRVTVYPTHSKNALLGLWDLYRQGVRVARKERVNLIVSADIFGCAWVAYALKCRLGVSMALQMFGDFVDNPYWLRERFRYRILNGVAKWLLRRADTIRVHGEGVKSKLVKRLGIEPDRIEVIPIPIRREPFLAVPEKKERGKMVLWAGRLVLQKNLPTLLHAAQKVVRRHPDARFRLIGSGSEEGKLRELAAHLGIAHEVEFAGPVPYEEIPKEFDRCDLFMLSSHYEDAPRVLMEASLAARPIVTTAVSGAGEAILDGKTGFIVPVGDAEALAERLCTLFEQPALASAMGLAGREHAKALWQFESVLEQLISWWEKSVTMKKRANPRTHPAVLIAESGSGFGGSAKYLSDFLSSLQEENFRVEVVAYGRGSFLERIEDLGYPLKYVPFLRFPWFEKRVDSFGGDRKNVWHYSAVLFSTLIQAAVFIPLLTLWLLSKRIRVVHLNNEIRSHIPLLLSARLAGCRVICQLHGWRHLTRIEKLSAPLVHLYVGITHLGTRFYQKEYPRGRYVTVVNGLRFEPEESFKKRSVRKELGLDEKTICLGIIGRLIHWKGQEVFLEAFQKIAKVEPHVYALVVGGTAGSSGSYRDFLRQRVKEMGLEGKVHFSGWQKDVKAYLAAMDIVVHASVSPEAFGLVIAEAMAEGKPVVATDGGGVPELIQDHQTGLLIPPKNVERLEEALLELIRDRALSAKMGEAARERILTHFDIRDNSRKIARIYRVLSGEKRLLRKRFLTTYPIPQSSLWTEKTHLVPLKKGKRRGLLARWGFRDITLVFRLFKLRKKFELLLTGCEREDCLFAFLQSLLPGRKIPHIMIDCLWKYEENPVRLALKRSLLRTISRSVDLFVVWSSEERKSYPAYFGMPHDKFVFMPHHSSLQGYPIETKNGHYIFSGGDSARDYDTFLKAVESLSVESVIVARRIASLNGNGRKSLPPNVTVKTTDPAEFRRLMAESRMVVLPFLGKTLQSTGQQSYLNAMRLKKPVIVSHVPGVLDYMTPDVTGIVVPPGNPAALRQAILRVLSGGPEIERMVEAAHQRVTQEFTLSHFVERLVVLLEAFHDKS